MSPILENIMPPEKHTKLSRPEKGDWSTYLAEIITKQVGLMDAMSSIECALIRQALEMTGSNVLQTAVLLKIPRGTLRYKMEKHGLH